MLLTSDIFGSHVAFVNRFVRQHRLTNQVANGVDVANIGFHLLINRNETTLVNLNAGFICSNQTTVWLTANCYQYFVVTDWLSRRVLTFKAYIQTIVFGFNAGNLSFQHDVEFFFVGLHEDLHDVFISSRD